MMANKVTEFKGFSKFLLPVSLVFFLVISSPALSFAQETGSFYVDIKYNTGDRLDTYQTILEVFRDDDTEPYVTIEFPETNPYLVDSLPLGSKYKVDVYVNGMFAETGKVDLQGTGQTLQLLISPSGGMRFNVFYSNGETPIEGALLTIKSHDGRTWGVKNTDADGLTTRFWLQPNERASDYYIVEVTIDGSITYTHSPVDFFSKVQGDVKIVTPWPAKIQDLVTISVFKDPLHKISKLDGDFVVEIYDTNNEKVVQSQVSNRGDAFFANLKVGQYFLKAVKEVEDGSELWGTMTSPITGGQTISIFVKVPFEQEQKTCNCVAFRLDDIQDYYVNVPQREVIKTFQGKSADLTLSVIGGFFGDDPNIVEFVKKRAQSESPQLEIASHSWNNSPLVNYPKEVQLTLLKQTDERLQDVLGVTPTSFIPPENLFNNDTVAALQEIGYTHFTGHVETQTYPKYSLEDEAIYYFPAYAETAKLNLETNIWDTKTSDEIFERLVESLNSHGFAVVMMHPYEFSVENFGQYTNEANQQQLDVLSDLIDKIRNAGIRIVTLTEITQEITPMSAPIEIEVVDVTPVEPLQADLSCNCVSFRFLTLQDYWLNDVQIKVMDTFVKKDAVVSAGIIGSLFGNDAKLAGFLKNSLLQDRQSIEITNNGWSFEDFTDFTQEEQEFLIKQGNDKITKVLGKTPSVFAPPFESFNDATIQAMLANDINYISATIKKDPPPYQLNNAEVYHFPGGPAIGEYDSDSGFFRGAKHEQTLNEVKQTIDKYGFAVVTLHPQEFSVASNSTYKNQANEQQIQELELLIDKIQGEGLKIVPISQINLHVKETAIPPWIKNNAYWWAESQIGDSDFVSGIQYLLNQEIIRIPPTAQGIGAESTEIPPWIKNNAGWWAEDLITDTDFLSGIQWLITNGIIKLSF